MEYKKFMERPRPASDPAAQQADFNEYVRSYNEDFMFFLRRAATGYYDGLVRTGRTLKDLHEMIVFLQSATKMKFEIIPYPFTFRHGREYYRSLGFDDSQIDNIESFFDYVKVTFKKDFEACMSEKPESRRSK